MCMLLRRCVLRRRTWRGEIIHTQPRCALSAMRERLFRAQSFVIFVYDRAKMKVPVVHTSHLSARKQQTYVHIPRDECVYVCERHLSRTRHADVCKAAPLSQFRPLRRGEINPLGTLKKRPASGIHRLAENSFCFCNVSGVAEKG